VSFRELPIDISRKQKSELMDQKIIEFEDFMAQIEDKHKYFQSVSLYFYNLCIATGLET
jgi:hypothetical protein